MPGRRGRLFPPALLPAPPPGPLSVCPATPLPPSPERQEGQPRAACYTTEALAAIAADPVNFVAPGGESQANVERRVAAFVSEQVLPLLQPDGPPAVLVAHGLAIKW